MYDDGKLREKTKRKRSCIAFRVVQYRKVTKGTLQLINLYPMHSENEEKIMKGYYFFISGVFHGKFVYYMCQMTQIIIIFWYVSLDAKHKHILLRFSCNHLWRISLKMRSTVHRVNKIIRFTTVHDFLWWIYVQKCWF